MGGGRRRELARGLGLGLVAWPHKWLPNLFNLIHVLLKYLPTDAISIS